MRHPTNFFFEFFGRTILNCGSKTLPFRDKILAEGTWLFLNSDKSKTLVQSNDVDYTVCERAIHSRQAAPRLQRSAGLPSMTTVSKNDLIILIDLSLGAHGAGYAGTVARTQHNIIIGRITGLDPAGPYFTGLPVSVRLDPTDAAVVDTVCSIFESSFALFSQKCNKNVWGHFRRLWLTGDRSCSTSPWDPLLRVDTSVRWLKNHKCSIQKQKWPSSSPSYRILTFADFYPNGGLDQPGCDRGSVIAFVVLSPLHLSSFESEFHWMERICIEYFQVSSSINFCTFCLGYLEEFSTGQPWTALDSVR